MRCAWDALLGLLPQIIREEVDRQGREQLQELRLRLGMTPELQLKNGSIRLRQRVTREMLQYVINSGCRYSPWTATTAASGYITAQGGHRIGLCGEVILRNSQMVDVKNLTSICIRVARDFPGIGAKVPVCGSLLIIGRPGCGKTTLLRDIIRNRSEYGQGSVGVVDERGELFPAFQGTPCFPTGSRTDILSGCPKGQGIELLLRTMSPGTIAVDEITADSDCKGLLHAAWCGVDLIATAHAGSMRDFLMRPVYRPLVESHIFTKVIVMQPDKLWREERMSI